MFGKFIIASIALVSATAFAEPKEVQQTVVCDNASDMLPYLEKEHGEQPIFIGIQTAKDNSETYVAVLVNTETQSWTVVVYDAQAACLLEAGEGFKYKMPEAPKGEL